MAASVLVVVAWKSRVPDGACATTIAAQNTTATKAAPSSTRVRFRIIKPSWNPEPRFPDESLARRRRSRRDTATYARIRSSVDALIAPCSAGGQDYTYKREGGTQRDPGRQRAAPAVAQEGRYGQYFGLLAAAAVVAQEQRGSVG